MKALFFILIYSVYLNSFGQTFNCLNRFKSVILGPDDNIEIKERSLSLLHQRLLHYASNQGMHEQHIKELELQLKTMPDITEKEGREILIDPLMHLRSDQEKSDTIRRLPEILTDSRSIDPILSSSLGKNLSETNRELLSYAFSLGINDDIRKKLAEKLVILPHILRQEEGADFIHYLSSLRKSDQLLAIESADQIVSGHIKSKIIQEFIQLQAQVANKESNLYMSYYNKSLIDLEQGNSYKKAFIRLQLSLGIIRTPSLNRELLGLGYHNKALKDQARKLAEQYIEQNRRFIYECRRKATWKNAKSAVKNEFMAFSTWKRPAISIPFTFAYNTHRWLPEVALQVGLEYILKVFGHMITARIFTGFHDSDLVKLIKRFGFSRFYGILTASLLGIIFAWSENREETQIFQEMVASETKRKELVSMVEAMKNDGVYEEFVEGLLQFGRMKFAQSQNEDLSPEKIDWHNITAEELEQDDIKKIVRKAINEYLYDQKRDNIIFNVLPHSGSRAVDFWVFNSLYAIPFNFIDYIFDLHVYNKICVKLNSTYRSKQAMMQRFYTAKKIISDQIYFPLRRAFIGL